MGNQEDMARYMIRELYGSVPRFAEVIGMPPTTVYHALERGLDNTRTETSNRIRECLYGPGMVPQGEVLSPEEKKLLGLFRQSSAFGRESILHMAEAIAVQFAEE